MANNFTVVGSRPGIAQVGNLQTQNVVFVSITTLPSQIYVEFPVQSSVYSSSVVDAGATSWAFIAEELAALPYVSGVAWGQDVNDSNQLVVMWTITVTSTSGNSAAQLVVANSALGADAHAAAVAALHDQLDAAEGL